MNANVDRADGAQTADDVGVHQPQMLQMSLTPWSYANAQSYVSVMRMGSSCPHEPLTSSYR